MSPQTAIIPLFTHFVFVLYLAYMMMDVLLRNRRSIEHKLAFGIILCSMLLFLEEFIRHYLPIGYSSMITAIWFSTTGITIVGLGLHLFIRLTHLDRRMPHFFSRYLFPYICYVPTLLVILNLIFNDQMVSGGAFREAGIWKIPVYNSAYYIAMIGGNLFNIIYVSILLYGKRQTDNRERLNIYNLLMLGIASTALANLGLGLVDFNGYLPPYPYLYGNIVWCVLLRYTMMKYDFLNHTDKRYEKLFNMNPAAILLIDAQGRVRDANPSARQLFRDVQPEHSNVLYELDEAIRRRIDDQAEIRSCEMRIVRGERQLDMLIDGDYVWVDNEPHIILIVRDITAEKRNQQAITFLAYHDALTRLPNRRSFMDKLDETIAKADIDKRMLAVALFDIDAFKGINDRFGHFNGDQALVHVADRLRSVIQPHEGMAARLGGDEFVLYLYPVDTRQSVEAKIQQLMRQLDEHRLIIGDTQLTVRISVGISLYPEHGGEAGTLLSNADKALYQVKRNGRNHYSFFADHDGYAESSGL